MIPLPLIIKPNSLESRERSPQGASFYRQTMISCNKHDDYPSISFRPGILPQEGQPGNISKKSARGVQIPDHPMMKRAVGAETCPETKLVAAAEPLRPPNKVPSSSKPRTRLLHQDKTAESPTRVQSHGESRQ